MIGTTLGPYRIVERLGRGGMAAVYKAYQPSLDRYVALKVLPAHLTDEPGFAERFRREARAVAKLEHPHILAVHDYGQEGDLAYIAMRYVEGGTLKDLLGKPLELPLAVELIRQIADALDYAHEHGVIHRDVKPSNVLMDRGNWALLTDFGVARMVEATQQLTGTGVGVGTPAYMSPEQGQGKKVDRRSDVYSLGVVLYEMLTGRVPYEAETPLAVVWKHANEPLPLPRSLNPQIPEPVERVVLKALAKAPEDRFRTTGVVAEVLQALGQLESVISAQPPPIPAATAEPVVDREIATPPPARRIGMSRFVRYLPYALGAGLLVFGAIRLWRGRGIVGDQLRGVPATEVSPASVPLDATELALPFALAEVAQEDIGSGVLSIAWSPDGTLVAIGTFDHKVRFYDTSLNRLVNTLEGHVGAVTSLAWSPNSGQLASGSGDRTIRIWDSAGWWPILEIDGHQDTVSTLSWSPDGTMLASGGADHWIGVWDTHDGHRIATLVDHPDAVSSVAWSPDGRKLASASRDGTLQIWDPAAWAVVRTLKRGGIGTSSLAWSPDGANLVLGRADGELWLVEISGTGLQRIFLGHTANARAVDWSPDSSMVASAGWDSTIRVWDVETGNALSIYRWGDARANAVAWSPDGSRLVAGRGDGMLLLLSTTGPLEPEAPEAESG